MVDPQVTQAVLLESEAVLKKWLGSGKNDVNEAIDNENTTLLHLAATNRKSVSATMLLKKGANPNAQDKKGWTPVHCAAKAKEFSLCDLFMSHGGNPNLENSSNSTATMYLARAAEGLDDLKVLKTCLEMCDDPNGLSGNGETLLHTTCLEGAGSTIDWLIAHGIDAQALTSRGETCLHYAVRARNVAAIQVLLESTVDVSARDQNDQTALDEAITTDFQEAIDLINDAAEKHAANNPWSVIKAKAPARRARSYHQAAMVGDDLVVFGGQFKAIQFSDQVLTFDFSDRAWNPVRTTGAKAPGVAGHSMTPLPDGKAIIFGGHNAGTSMPTLLQLDVKAAEWTELSQYSSSRCYHSAVYDEERNQLVIFGGSLNKGKDELTSDVLLFDMTKKAWSSMPHGSNWPEPRMKHTATLVGDEMFVIGGVGENGALNDVCVLNLESMTWSQPKLQGSPPAPRFSHTTTPLTTESNLLIHGGSDGTDNFDDLWILKTDSGRWSAYPHVETRPRFGHAAAKGEGDLLYFTGGDGSFLLRTLELKKMPIQRAVVQLAKREANPLTLIKEDSKKKRKSARPSKKKSPAQGFSISSPTPKDGEPAQVAASGSLQVINRTKKSSRLTSSDGGSSAASTTSSSGSSIGGVSGPREPSSLKKSVRASKKDSPKPIEKAKAPQLSKRAMMERIEKLETFSNTLSKDVLELVKLVESEFNAEKPMADPKTAAEIQGLMGTIQAFCVFNRPPKTWAGSGVAEKKKEDKPQKAPFPRHHFVNISIPPKRVQPDLSTKEGETADEKAIRKRNLVFNEILSTETDYVRDLAVTIGLYVKPLSEEYSDMVGAYEQKTLFKNVEELWEVNNHLLKVLLEEWEKPPTEQKVGKVFLDNIEELKKYKPYCANQVTTEETVERLLMENREFAAFVDEVQKMEESNRQGVQSYLLKPFQRITRYPLLLRELGKNTPESFADAEPLKKAIDAVNGLVKGANETTRVNEQMAALLELQNKLNPAPECPELSHLHQYKLVEELQCKEIPDVKKGSAKKATVHIFKTMLLITRPSKGRLSKRFLFKLDGISAIDDQLVVPKMKFPVQIDCGEESCVLSMATGEQRDAFLTKLREFMPSSS